MSEFYRVPDLDDRNYFMEPDEPDLSINAAIDLLESTLARWEASLQLCEAKQMPDGKVVRHLTEYRLLYRKCIALEMGIEALEDQNRRGGDPMDGDGEP